MLSRIGRGLEGSVEGGSTSMTELLWWMVGSVNNSLTL